jgi:hypothetical protein
MLILSGTWELRREGKSFWQPASVPGCWEQTGMLKNDPGPYWYRTSFDIPKEYSGKRVWLRFNAVSYACRIYINGQYAGEHTGMWDSFILEITNLIQPGETVELLVQVEKPASLTAGPDSPHVPGKYLLRETLSGFLPYVWGHAFGGIWQDVGLYATGDRHLGDVWVRGNPDGQVRATISVSSPGPVRVVISDPNGENIWDQTTFIDQIAEIETHISNPRPWSHITPTLYSAKINLPEDDERIIPFGLRSFEAQGNILSLNGQPVYPRLILSWGWYAGTLHPDPGIEQVRIDMLRLRALGYNGIKLCLWFPPFYYFNLADEMGMLLWVELPMWLPLPNEGYRGQVLREYGRLVKQARQHPSVVLYTLGCELGQTVDGGFLGQLYTQTKKLTEGALVRDNSGSSEAYYGPMCEHADFDDNHLYSELQYLRPMLDAFAPHWRSKKPWLMGEFSDYDTFPAAVAQWWVNSDPGVNPQGARWEMRAVTHADRLRQYGLQEKLKDLAAASYQQALVHRKNTIEAVRTRGELSGYVVTGEADTPISTAGMWDINGGVKFTPDEFIPFNQDFVLALGWDRRRAWVAGGDRPSPRDRYNHASGSLVRIHLVGSNYSQHKAVAYPAWEIAFPGEMPFSFREISPQIEISSGKVQGLAVIEFLAPQVNAPRKATLRAWGDLDRQHIVNTWPIWFFPSEPWAGVPPFGLFDPLNIMSDLPVLSGGQCIQALDGVSVAVCSGWNESVDAFVKGGGKAVVMEGLHNMTGPLPVVAVPYWREALKLIEDHPAWGNFPHGNAPDMQFYTLATDCALDMAGFQGNFSPIYRRLDMRGMEFLEYAVELEWGRGRVLATTLRFAGGLGDQPTGLKYCPASQHLLANWVRSLHL